jgi:hypothetical protein
MCPHRVFGRDGDDVLTGAGDAARKPSDVGALPRALRAREELEGRRLPKWLLAPADRPHRHVGREDGLKPRLAVDTSESNIVVGQPEQPDQVAFDAAGVTVNRLDALESVSADPIVDTDQHREPVARVSVRARRAINGDRLTLHRARSSPCPTGHDWVNRWSSSYADP